GIRDFHVTGVQTCALPIFTERRAAEKQQKVLAAELSHRVKNALTVVQALASQTAAHCSSLEEFQDVFGGRLRAFAKAHSQLIEQIGRASCRERGCGSAEYG